MPDLAAGLSESVEERGGDRRAMECEQCRCSVSELDAIRSEAGVPPASAASEKSDVQPEPRRESCDDRYDSRGSARDGAAPSYDSTGRGTYNLVCKMLNQLPSSLVLRGLDQEKLYLRHHGLGPEGTKALCITLLNNTHVKVLDLGDNGLEAMGALQVARMLNENYYVTDLNLSGNNIGPRGAVILAGLIKDSDTIFKLDISCNSIGDRVWGKMAEALAENNKLYELNLSNNCLGPSAADHLSKVIAKYDVLKFLDLSWNHIRKAGGVALCSALKANTSLIALNLAYNGLGDDGAAELGQALRSNRSLQDLDVTSNRIGYPGAAFIAKGLAANQGLKILEAGLNSFQAAGSLVILRSVVGHKGGQLLFLSFDRTQVDSDFLKICGNIKSSGRKITVIHGGLLGNWNQEEAKMKAKMGLGAKIALADTTEDQKQKLLQLFKAVDSQGTWQIALEELKSSLMHKELGLEHQVEPIMMVAEHYALDGKVQYSCL